MVSTAPSNAFARMEPPAAGVTGAVCVDQAGLGQPVNWSVPWVCLVLAATRTANVGTDIATAAQEAAAAVLGGVARSARMVSKPQPDSISDP